MLKNDAAIQFEQNGSISTQNVEIREDMETYACSQMVQQQNNYQNYSTNSAYLKQLYEVIHIHFYKDITL